MTILKTILLILKRYFGGVVIFFVPILVAYFYSSSLPSVYISRVIVSIGTYESIAGKRFVQDPSEVAYLFNQSLPPNAIAFANQKSSAAVVRGTSILEFQYYSIDRGDSVRFLDGYVNNLVSEHRDFVDKLTQRRIELVGELMNSKSSILVSSSQIFDHPTYTKTLSPISTSKIPHEGMMKRSILLSLLISIFGVMLYALYICRRP